MQIVDAQIHTWGTGLPSNLSHRQVTHFTPEEAIALMDAGGVDAAVIHPPGWDPNSTDMAFAAVRNYPGRFAIMGSLPLDRPESRARIAAWRDQPGMLGLRYTFLHDPARQRLHDGAFDWLWAEAEKAGVPIAMLATDSLDRSWPHRRAPSRPALDHRSPGRPRRPHHAERRCRHDPYPAASGAGEISQRGGQGDRRAGLFQRGLSVPHDAHLSAPDLRRVRSAPHVLGHRHHENAVLLAPMRDDVHRGTALAQRPGQAPGHGRRAVRLVGLEPRPPDNLAPAITTVQRRNQPIAQGNLAT